MTLHIPIVLVLGLIIAIFIRGRTLKATHAVAAGLLGFNLYGSSLTPSLSPTRRRVGRCPAVHPPSAISGR
jgi:hypothetical protein